MTEPVLLRDKRAVRAAAAEARALGRTVGFVPTMGYLHEGHARLMRALRPEVDVLVASIFVNPTQFGPNEDLDRYPRDLARDLRVCGEEGVDLVFAPEDPRAIYPEGFQTWVEVTDVTTGYCGAGRPGHFRGVTTVVTKLFNLVQPHLAAFGEKDYQQLTAIRTMVRDLDMGVEVVPVPTAREPDGLAMSSRNAYLDEGARRRALALSQGLLAARTVFAGGARTAGPVVAAAREVVLAEADEVEYVALAHPDTMKPLEGEDPVDGRTRLLVAAFVVNDDGRRTRLIDNGALEG